MNNEKPMKRVLFLFLIFFLFPPFLDVSAITIEKLDNIPITNDFVLGPGKIEVIMKPGETITRTLSITNRLGRTTNFRVDFEDFIGSPTGERASILLGEAKGPNSLKDYLKSEVKEFVLNQGEKIILPIQISLPSDIEPGGFYGAVLISTIPSPGLLKNEDVVKSQIQLVSRLGTLFFVRTEGEVFEEGHLEKFNTLTSGKFFEKGPISFSILYRNTGSVHLDPYGVIEIKNLFGRKIGEVDIEPYFVMPKSLREIQVRWQREISFGKYTATLYLNRGYQNLIDKAEISFWILPWKFLIVSAACISLLILAFWWIITHFEIRRKK